MCAETTPASVAEALGAMQKLARFVAEAGAAELPAAVLAEGLQRMERVGGVLAAAQGRFAAAFDAQDGHLADGQRTLRAWYVHTLRVTRGQAAEYKALEAVAREHEVLQAGLIDTAVPKSLALLLARWTRELPAEFRAQAEDIPAPRGALLYSRFSREEFGGYSWA